MHPADTGGSEEIYLMCADLKATIAVLQDKDTACDAIAEPGWGLLTHIRLPGGGELGLYESRHARPANPS